MLRSENDVPLDDPLKWVVAMDTNISRVQQAHSSSNVEDDLLSGGTPDFGLREYPRVGIDVSHEWVTTSTSSTFTSLPPTSSPQQPVLTLAPYQIFVKLVCGSTITLSVDPKSTVLMLKYQICGVVGIPAEDQRLMVNGH